MQKLIHLIEKYGEFHDVEILNIDLNINLNSLKIYINNINSNFEKLSKCNEAISGYIIFQKINNLFIDFKIIDEIKVYSISINNDIVLINFWPSGIIKFSFENIESSFN